MDIDGEKLKVSNPKIFTTFNKPLTLSNELESNQVKK